MGWLAGFLMVSTGKVQRLEEVAVGAFGAVIGAESVAALFQGDKPVPGITGMGIAGAFGGAVVLLALLRMMRGAVGPMRSRKSPAARRR